MLDSSLILQSLDYLGTFAFGLSGAMVAVRKKMDIFGVVVLATVTAIGGGTIRDLLLGRTPNFWMEDPTYLYLAVAAGLVIFVAFRTLERGEKALIVFDAIGLGVFTVIGALFAIQAQVGGVATVVLATLTGVGGGILRDLLAREVPIVLREEVYASASILGATAFWFTVKAGLAPEIAAPIAAALVIAIRLVSRRFHWQLPRPTHNEPGLGGSQN